MASRTQLRLAQVTGSFGDFEGGIVDNLSTAATLAAIPAGSGSMVSVLSQFASSIQRIHGGTAFTTNEAGIFSHTIDVTGAVTSSAGVKVGGDLDVNTSAVIGSDLLVSNDVFLRSDAAVLNFGADNDVTFTHNGTNGLNIASAGAFDIDAVGAIAMDSTAGISLDAAAASNFTTSAGALTLRGADGETVGTSGQTTSLLGALSVDEAATFDSNVTIGGNLNVNGTVTTIDTANLQVEDAVILLGSGSSGEGAAGDRGLIMAIASETNPAFFWDESDDEFAFVRTNAEANASTITADAYANIKAAAIEGSSFVSSITDNQIIISNAGTFEGSDSLTFDGSDLQLADGIGLVFSTDDAEKIESDGADLNIYSGGQINLTAGTNSDVVIPANVGLILDGSGGNEKIESDGTDLSINSGNNIKLGAVNGNILLLSGSTEMGKFYMDTDLSALILSSSAANDLILDSNSSKIIFGKDFLGSSPSTGIAAVIGAESFAFATSDNLDATAWSVKVAASDTYANQYLGVSGSIRIYEDGASPNYVGINVPTLSGDYTLTLPSANGTSGQVLKLSDENGNLTFGDATGDLTKFVFKSTQTVAAGNVDFGASKTSGISALSVGTADLSITKSDSDLNKALEVYVNGQLLLSGSSAGLDYDYEYVNASTLKFAFALEADDIIQVIQR